MNADVCMLCDTEPCRCAEIYCGHLVKRGECIFCDDRPHVVLACKTCGVKGGQTWHTIKDETATCRKCGTTRNSEITMDDIGISS